MKRERRKLTARELKFITTPDLVRRIRADEEKLGQIHEEDITRQHEDEDIYWKGSRA